MEIWLDDIEIFRELLQAIAVGRIYEFLFYPWKVYLEVHIHRG